MKKIVLFILIAVMFIFGFYLFKDDSSQWILSTDKYGNRVYTTDKTEKEINEDEIEKLSNMYKNDSTFEYEFKKQEVVCDTRNNIDSKFLVSKTRVWDQGDILKYKDGESVTFLFNEPYKTLSQDSKIELKPLSEYTFDGSYSHCLGLFTNFTVTKYSIVKIDKTTKEAISTEDENIMSVIGYSIIPIYNKSLDTITYQLDNTWYNAKTFNIKNNEIPSSVNDMIDATTGILLME